MLFRVNGFMPYMRARRVFAKIVVAFPVLRRSDGSRHKATTTVRTDVFQDVVNARSTERALVGTDACRKRSRRQRPIAILTSWSQFKHEQRAQRAKSKELRA